MKRSRTRRVLLSLYNYFVFFLLIAFIVSCCLILFTNTLAETFGLTLTAGNLGTAARLTFGNVLLLSLLCTFVDGVRRRFMVERPVRRITQAAMKLTAGDFSVRISPSRFAEPEDGFRTIIDCFNKMAEELSGMETLRSDFIANVSHELKTPLAVMHNYGVMLQQPDLPEEKRLEYAGAITEASRRLADLVSNILKLNKLENQQIFPQVRPYDLGEQLCTCLLGFEKAWERKALEIETSLENDVRVSADPEMMSLVWNNLFSNAVKFTPTGGRVSLSLRTEGNDAVVRVSDTGCGISSEVGRRMFDKFYQGDPSHSAQGNGLGLALVKRVIDISGSDISVESEVGKGSTFTVRMRRASNEAMQNDSG